MKKINDRQVSLLLSFKHSHDEGLRSAPYFSPLGIGRLQLGGEGQSLVGLIKRGMITEKNNIFYITDAGLAALENAKGGGR